MRSHLALWVLIESLAGDTGDGQFTDATFALGAEFYCGPRFSSHHLYDLFIGLAGDRLAVDRHDFISVLKALLAVQDQLDTHGPRIVRPDPRYGPPQHAATRRSRPSVGWDRLHAVAGPDSLVCPAPQQPISHSSSLKSDTA